MLYLIGLGPGPGFATETAARVLREVDCVFFEDYTGPLDLESLKRLSGREPVRLSRRDLEEESGRKIFECMSGGRSAALVTAGDPQLATSHAALAAAAAARGFKVVVVPGVSIVCAAFSISCLSVYKLGGVATVTYPRGGVYSERPYELVEYNLARGLHTLLLLDVREDGVYMTPSEAAGVLLELERRMGRGVFTPSRQVVVVWRLGWGGSVKKTTLGEAARWEEGGPAVFIVPARLSPVEEECIEALWNR
ncbi:MAG: diphthine synthase [Pyrobaculum sp.]